MVRILAASLVMLGLVGAIAAPAFAHRGASQTVVEEPFPPKDFWDQQQQRN